MNEWDSRNWNWSYSSDSTNIGWNDGIGSYKPIIRKWTEWQWMSTPITADDVIDTMLFIKRIKER